MIKARAFRGLLLGTALSASFAATGEAQAIRINDEQLADKTAECRQLGELVQGRTVPDRAASADAVVSAINENDAALCADLRETIASAGTGDPANGASERASGTADETERVSEEVDLSEEATIEGEAVVSVPEPEVDVQVPPPSVRVIEQQPQIDIMQEAAQIDVRQERPRIAVEIPEIIVRVDIPAPQLYVLRQDPQVRVSAADPQVEVVQGEPRVSVRQADPELSVDLGVDMGEQEAEGMRTADAQDQDDSPQRVEGEVSVDDGQPRVEIVEAEGQPRMTFESGQPQIAYENVEPEVTVMMAERPTIDVRRTGEASIVLETPEEREARRQRQRETAMSDEPVARQEAGMAQDAGASADRPAEGSAVTVGDLRDMEVVTADGENLGEPVAFIEINGEPHVVLESGGFLGIGGKEVPVPFSRVSIRGGQLMLDNLTHEEIEAASGFEYDDNLALPDERPLAIGG